MKVLVRHSFDVEEEWEDKYATKEHIEFYYNEGTSCANNILEAIKSKRIELGYHCFCPMQSSVVLKINDQDA